MSIFWDAYRGRRVLVTGHTGFKGSWLCLWLHELGADVFGFALEPPTQPSAFDIFAQHIFAKRRDMRADIRDLGALTSAVNEAKPDFVFHLAAQPLVRDSYSNPLETIETNIVGTANLLEVLRRRNAPYSVIVVTSDKCYENRESGQAYRENEPLGGHDVYSTSKAAAELIAAAWRRSFFQTAEPNERVRLATARAGNVIGGGDYASNRILPDAVRAIEKGKPVLVRNPSATRPWQHVLECLSGYLSLGAQLSRAGSAEELSRLESAFNFGPEAQANRSVRELISAFLTHFPGSEWEDVSAENKTAPHEAGRLNLNIDKAKGVLDWQPVWRFEDAIARTADWYKVRTTDGDAAALTLSLSEIEEYEHAAGKRQLTWAASISK